MLAAVMTMPLMLAGASGCEMTTSRPELDTGPALSPGVPRIYVDIPFCQPGCDIPAPWIYEESNSVEGLQRHDEQHDDTCGGAAGAGDTLIF
jgi:hypothetical protein